MIKSSKKVEVNGKIRESGLGHKLNVRVNKTKKEEKTVAERTIDKEEFIEGFDDKVEHYVENYVDHVERNKRLTLISGVGFFMLLIIFFYAYNFKFQISTLVSSDEEEVGIDNQMEMIKSNVGSMVDDYKEIKEVINKEISDSDIEEDQTILEMPEQKVLPESDSIENSVDVSMEELKEKLLEKNVAMPTGRQE
ncbi:MAG: hypothetical protein PF572_00530 [Patescibacteria group bacterium]|jgi:Fe2+ transport system protein B|nr:hypothetical protein [Patescibacteria group bacterium]